MSCECKCSGKFTGVWIALGVIFVLALASCGRQGDVEFRDHTFCGITGELESHCPDASRTIREGGGNEEVSPITLKTGYHTLPNDRKGIWAEGELPGGFVGSGTSFDKTTLVDMNHVVREDAATSGEVTYSNSLGGGIVARVAEFGEINGNLIVSAVDVTDGSFVADFGTDRGRLVLEKPNVGDFGSTTITIGNIKLNNVEYKIAETGPIIERFERVNGFGTDDPPGYEYLIPEPAPDVTAVYDLVGTGGSVSGKFQQHVADSSPRHPPWKRGGPTWVSHRTGVFHFGVE